MAAVWLTHTVDKIKDQCCQFYAWRDRFFASWGHTQMREAQQDVHIPSSIVLAYGIRIRLITYRKAILLGIAEVDMLSVLLSVFSDNKNRKCIESVRGV